MNGLKSNEIEEVVNMLVIDYVEKKIGFDKVEIYDQLERDNRNDLWAI